jgi:hypothetical protein
MTMGREVHETLERGGPCARGNAERRRLAEAAIEHDDAGEGSE